METEHLQAAIDAAWEQRDSITSATGGAVQLAVEEALAGLDTGR